MSGSRIIVLLIFSILVLAACSSGTSNNDADHQSDFDGVLDTDQSTDTDETGDHDVLIDTDEWTDDDSISRPDEEAADSAPDNDMHFPVNTIIDLTKPLTQMGATNAFVSSDRSLIWTTWYQKRADVDDYEFRAQLLDVNKGKKLFADEGIVINKHAFDNYVAIYRLAVDPYGTLFATSVDFRLQTTQSSYLYSVHPDGTLRWGEDGVRLAVNEYGSSYATSLELGADNRPVVITENEKEENNKTVHWLILNKLDEDGNLLWGQNGIAIMNSGKSAEFASLTRSADSLYCIWTERMLEEKNIRTVYVRKLASDGSSVWGKDVAVLVDKTTGIRVLYQSVADSAGGLFIIAQAGEEDNPGHSVIVAQHIDAAGTLDVTTKGVQISTSTMTQVNFRAQFLPQPGLLAIFWNMTNSAQTQVASYAQVLSPALEKLWGDEGLELIPFQSAEANAPFLVSIPWYSSTIWPLYDLSNALEVGIPASLTLPITETPPSTIPPLTPFLNQGEYDDVSAYSFDATSYFYIWVEKTKEINQFRAMFRQP